MPTLIREYPKLEWAAGEKHKLVLDPITLPTGRTLADFAAFSATIYEDPEYPRAGAAKHATLDPVGDGWTAAATATGAVVGSTLEFTFTVPSGVGQRRYAIGARGTGGTAGPVQMREMLWLTVLPGGG